MLDQHIDISIITVIAYQQQQRRQQETQTIPCLRKSQPKCFIISSTELGRPSSISGS